MCPLYRRPYQSTTGVHSLNILSRCLHQLRERDASQQLDISLSFQAPLICYRELTQVRLKEPALSAK